MERLHKYLAHCGVASRRKAEKLIAEGRIRVNGETISTFGVKIDPAKDTVTVDGKRVRTEAKVTYLLNKSFVYPILKELPSIITAPGGPSFCRKQYSRLFLSLKA